MTGKIYETTTYLDSIQCTEKTVLNPILVWEELENTNRLQNIIYNFATFLTDQEYTSAKEERDLFFKAIKKQGFTAVKATSVPGSDFCFKIFVTKSSITL